MVTSIASPKEADLRVLLGKSYENWIGTIRALQEVYPQLTCLWKTAKIDFGHVCLLRHKKRTLLYLLPEKGRVLAAVVLGQRAFELAMGSSLPDSIKTLLSEARPYVEGRGIRFPVTSIADISVVAKLVEIKTTPIKPLRRSP
jgi:hypothetical protein